MVGPCVCVGAMSSRICSHIAKYFPGACKPERSKSASPRRGLARGREGVEGFSVGQLLHSTVFKINCNGREM